MKPVRVEYVNTSHPEVHFGFGYIVGYTHGGTGWGAQVLVVFDSGVIRSMAPELLIARVPVEVIS